MNFLRRTIRYFILFISVSTMLLADLSFSSIPQEKIEDTDKYNLGKRLFFDQNLSSDKTISCATCHILSQGGTDNLRISLGVEGRKGKINTPTIFNTKYNIAKDWAGEYTTIKKRSKMAFLNPIEMDGNYKDLIKYIESDSYLKEEFFNIYTELTKDNIFDSIAYFVSTLTTPNSKFDNYLDAKVSLNQNEKKGYKLFKSYGCVSCHNGVNVGGNMYQKFGIFNDDYIYRDENLGRYEVTGKESDKYVFKVPSLRNITKTAPYFHNGATKNLKDTIYKMGEYQLGVEIPDKDIILIETFLKTLEANVSYEN